MNPRARYLLKVFLYSCTLSIATGVGVFALGWPGWIIVPVAYGGVFVLMIVTTTVDIIRGDGPGGPSRPG